MRTEALLPHFFTWTRMAGSRVSTFAIHGAGGCGCKGSLDTILTGVGGDERHLTPLVNSSESTLRRFVEAAGGTLELRVTLPGKGVMHLTGLGELNA